MQNRRHFLKTLLGVIVIPTATLKALSQTSVTKTGSDEMWEICHKGWEKHSINEFLKSGYIYCPYIPLGITRCDITAKKKKIECPFEVEIQPIECWDSI
jgi:hypothetical protein